MDQLHWHVCSGESADDLFQLIGTCRADSLVVACEMALGMKAANKGARYRRPRDDPSTVG